jgi:predicted nucleic acid-binding protein
VIALIDGDDREHRRCARVAEETSEQFVIPALTLPEVDYLLRKRRRGDVWSALVRDVAAGSYRLHAPDERALVRAAELEEEYHDLRLGFVDASVIATCETLGETKVATLDHRHFSVVRPRHCDALTLLPE